MPVARAPVIIDRGKRPCERLLETTVRTVTVQNRRPFTKGGAITFELYAETSEMDALAATIGVIFTIIEDVAASAKSRRGDIAPRCTQQNNTRAASVRRADWQVTHNTYIVTPVTSANL
jgi:hypothetical protein